MHNMTCTYIYYSSEEGRVTSKKKKQMTSKSCDDVKQAREGRYIHIVCNYLVTVGRYCESTTMLPKLLSQVMSKYNT